MKLFIRASLLFAFVGIGTFISRAQENQQLYQIKIFHLENSTQGKKIDQFLESVYLPALHRTGISHVGVFKPIGQDTTSDPRIYVFTPFDSFSQFSSLSATLASDQQYQKDGIAYIQAANDQPLYTYFESILLRAFPLAPRIQESQLKTPKHNRIYELRSYGSPTEALHKNKVTMFNDGGEIGIFKKLDFNPVFYGDVLYGSNMPNLMYMTTFKDMNSRNKHWDAFGSDPKWKEISSMDQYQHNVSRVDIQFLHPAAYSDL